MHKASYGGVGSACFCEDSRSPTIRGLLAIWGFYPHFGFLNDVEWEGGMFFQMKGKGQDGIILFLGKIKNNEKQNKKTELDYMVRM